MADILLTGALALVTFGAGMLGVLMALYPPSSDEMAKRNVYIAGFVILGLAGVALTFIQAIRAQSSQEEGALERNRLSNNMEYVRGQLVTLTSIVGPEAKADSKRIALALENISPMARKLEPSSKGLPLQQRSLRQRAIVVAGEILGCVAEGTAKIEPTSGRNEDVMKQIEANEKVLRDAASTCMQRLGPRIFDVGNELKRRFISDERFTLEMELLARHPDVESLSSIASKFENLAQKLPE